ncbi:TPA: hypothetical protein ACKJ1M_001536, partial [Neisseria gonorrhoeae]
HSCKNKKIKNRKLKYRHSRAGGNPAPSARKLIGKTVSLDFTFRIPAFAGMTGLKFQNLF